jgi:WXG100 family type VII secretion target
MSVVIDIHVDYDELEGVTSRLAQQAEEADAALRNCRSCLETLQSGAWIGKGANAFFTEMENDILPAQQRLYEALSFSNEMFNAVHNTIKQGEDDARVVFVRLSV